MILSVCGAGENDHWFISKADTQTVGEVLTHYPFILVLYQHSPNPKDLRFNYLYLTFQRSDWEANLCRSRSSLLEKEAGLGRVGTSDNG